MESSSRLFSCMAAEQSLLEAVHLSARMLVRNGRFEHRVKEVLETSMNALGALGGIIYLHQKRSSKLRILSIFPDGSSRMLKTREIPDDFGIAGEVFQSKKSSLLQSGDWGTDKNEWKLLKKIFNRSLESCMTYPLMMEEEQPLGVMQLINKKEGFFSSDDEVFMNTITTLIMMAYQNSMLLEESNRASQLLGMGKVAHDIKNLTHALEANVIFSDHTLNELREYAFEAKADDHLKNCVQSIDFMFEELTYSVDRVKRYSSLISDIASGKPLKPVKRLGLLSQNVQLGAAYLESEGRSQHIGMKYEMQHDAPQTMHDDMYVFRIVQNLVSNAIRAASENIFEKMPELKQGGYQNEYETYDDIYIRYKFETPFHIVEIEDHGMGMTRDMAERILTGNAMSSWHRHAGSGWGTKIVLELAATHDAKVNIESQYGKGTTVRVFFPHIER